MTGVSSISKTRSKRHRRWFMVRANPPNPIQPEEFNQLPPSRLIDQDHMRETSTRAIYALDKPAVNYRLLELGQVVDTKSAGGDLSIRLQRPIPRFLAAAWKPAKNLATTTPPRKVIALNCCTDAIANTDHRPPRFIS